MKQMIYKLEYKSEKTYPMFWYPSETDKQMDHRLRTEWLQSISKKKRGKK